MGGVISTARALMHFFFLFTCPDVIRVHVISGGGYGG